MLGGIAYSYCFNISYSNMYTFSNDYTGSRYLTFMYPYCIPRGIMWYESILASFFLKYFISLAQNLSVRSFRKFHKWVIEKKKKFCTFGKWKYFPSSHSMKIGHATYIPLSAENQSSKQCKLYMHYLFFFTVEAWRKGVIYLKIFLTKV